MTRATESAPKGITPTNTHPLISLTSTNRSDTKTHQYSPTIPQAKPPPPPPQHNQKVCHQTSTIRSTTTTDVNNHNHHDPYDDKRSGSLLKED
ncbi:hypothetical protein MTR_7g088315 [Medicago truncatula]|uniref:Uncharacterized protein n=1 Tax=Medicago truncatula TaxID=3880 RepID=A0A072U1H3_MEDTR|nr:hypothetical protein MTR_7g088315 [Medicago truncatula]